MAVDQARHLNFFREFNNSNNNPIQMANNNLYSNSNITDSLGLGVAGAAAVLPATTTSLNNESLLPFYNFNDVVIHQLAGAGKISPAVKDDSGVTFNNSLVPPPQVPASRKHQREPISCVPRSLLTTNPVRTTPSTNSSGIVNKECSSFSFFGEDLSLQIMQQQLELDRLISQHMENMRLEIEARKKQQVRRIMAAIEEAMGRRLRDKEEELDKIGKINWALEEKVKSLCVENHIWRDLAQTNEATANALRTNLEQVLQQVKGNVDRTAAGDLTDDAVSCCGSSGYGGKEKDRENEGDSDEQQRRLKRRIICDDKNDDDDGKRRWIYRGKRGDITTRMCRKCGAGESSVLLLPCRHLCLCTSCGPTVNACPICNSAKNASIHVNLS